MLNVQAKVVDFRQSFLEIIRGLEMSYKIMLKRPLHLTLLVKKIIFV